VTILTIAACVLILIIVIVLLLVHSHVSWLDRQSPVDDWVSDHNGMTIMLQFEEERPGKKAGIYKQITKLPDGKEVKEFGHCIVHRNKLHMLITASEITNNPIFGEDTIYQIEYVGPNAITINGPYRPWLLYQRAPKGTTIDFDLSEQ
jgi:hypothetical protein